MSTPTNGTPTDRDALERDIQRTRDHLAATADALAAKADVKGQAQAKVEDLKATAQHKVEDVRNQANAKVHDVSASAPGNPRQQTGVLVGVVVVATALVVWLVVRKR
jgi:hypothetical protein